MQLKLTKVNSYRKYYNQSRSQISLKYKTTINMPINLICYYYKEIIKIWKYNI